MGKNCDSFDELLEKSRKLKLENSERHNNWFVRKNRPVLTSQDAEIVWGTIKAVNKNNIQKPPASLLLKITDLLPRKYKQDIEQNISDMRLEYYEILSENKVWQARSIVTFYYIGLGWSIAMWVSDKVKEVIGIIPKKD